MNTIHPLRKDFVFHRCVTNTLGTLDQDIMFYTLVIFKEKKARRKREREIKFSLKTSFSFVQNYILLINENLLRNSRHVSVVAQYSLMLSAQHAWPLS